jgi:hypothetical protein
LLGLHFHRGHAGPRTLRVLLQADLQEDEHAKNKIHGKQQSASSVYYHYADLSLYCSFLTTLTAAGAAFASSSRSNRTSRWGKGKDMPAAITAS